MKVFVTGATGFVGPHLCAHLVASGDEVTARVVITCLGLRDSYEDVVRGALHPNVNADFLYRSDVPTTRKTRFIDPAHLRKLFEIYYFDDRPIDGALGAVQWGLGQSARDQAWAAGRAMSAADAVAYALDED